MRKKYSAIFILYLMIFTSPAFSQEFGIEGYTLKNLWGFTNNDKKAIVPGNVKIIQQAAFHGYSNFEEIVLPDGLLIIEDMAFQYCSNLRKINIPNSVIKIGEKAFLDCFNLEEINFPKSLIDIGHNAFKGTKVRNIPVFKNLSDSTFILLGSTLTNYVDNGAKTIIVPEHVKFIGKGVFANTSIEEVILPRGVIVIETEAFRFCRNLKKINIPNSVIKIGSVAFQDCTNLEEIIFPESLIDIGESAFTNTGVRNIVLPKKIISIANSAFRECINLISVSMSNSVNYIDESAFYKCINLERINIPNNCIIRDMVFVDCVKIRRQNFPQWQNSNDEFRIFEFHDNR